MNENMRPVVCRFYLLAATQDDLWIRINQYLYHTLYWSFDKLPEGTKLMRQFDPAETAIPGEHIYWMEANDQPDTLARNANVGH